VSEPNPWAAPGTMPEYYPAASWGPPPPVWPPPRPPRRGLTPAGIALAVLTALTLLAGLVTAVSRGDVRERKRMEALQAQVARELPALQAFTEKERGLKFLRPVTVKVLDDDDFLRRLYTEPDEDSQQSTEDLPAYDPPKTLLALGLIDSEEEFTDVLDQTFDDSVQGVYEFESKELVIRGRELNPLTRLVLVHELTHALQDQHFDIADRDFSATADEQQLAFTSLVEGDANRVDAAYRDTLSASDREELERLELRQFGGLSLDGPQVVFTLLGFPYAVGPEFVEGILRAGGQRALDAAFRNPPTTSEQIFDPAMFVRSPEAAVPVDRPKGTGELVDEGVLGEFGLRLIAGDGVIGEADASATDGWAGDYYATYVSGDTVCLRADIVMESTLDRDELRAELLELETDSDVLSVGDRQLQLRTCADLD
jgi:hypothetical protein